MPFTTILAVIVLLGLVVVFAITYARKGFKTALITTGIALVVFSILYVIAIFLVASAMS